MRAAPTLEAMRNLPGRCHELRGNRGGQLSIDLDGPYRLLFEVGSAEARRRIGLDKSHDHRCTRRGEHT